MEINNEKIASQAYELAYKYEQQRQHCSQCTLAAIMETFDVVDPNLFKAADGLTGGTVMSTQGTCGALSGGILAISSLTGRSYQAFCNGQSDHTWDYVRKLYFTFVEKYGSPIGCMVQKQLFGKSFDLLNQEERIEFANAGAHVDKCPSVCGDVAKWTTELILEIQKTSM